MKTSISLFLILLLLGSCTKEKIQSLPPARDLVLSQSVTMPHLCFHYGTLRDSLLMFLSLCDPDEKRIHIFDARTLRPITSLGENGRAASEFLLPVFYRSNFHDSVTRLYDIRLLHSKTIRLSSDPDSIRVEGKLLPSPLSSCNEMNRLNDSITIAQNYSTENTGFIIHNGHTDSVKWIMPHLNLPLPIEKNKAFVYSKHICAYGDRIIAAYRYFDVVEIYDSEGNFIKDVRFSPVEVPPFLLEMECLSPDAYLYFTDISGTPSHCYLTRLAVPMPNALQDLPDAHIIKMDWDGNVIDCYRYPHPMSFPILDTVANRMYLYTKNPEDPEQGLLGIYDLNL